MGKLSRELRERINIFENAVLNYSIVSGRKQEPETLEARQEAQAARATLEDAIHEAIQRSTLEHAEPAPQSSVSDLIDKLLEVAGARIVSPGWSADYDKARAKLEEFIVWLQQERHALRSQRDNAIKDYNLADAERVNLAARLADKETALQAALSINTEQGRTLEEMRGERDYHKQTKHAEIDAREKFHMERDEAWSRIRELESERDALGEAVATRDEWLRKQRELNEDYRAQLETTRAEIAKLSGSYEVLRLDNSSTQKHRDALQNKNEQFAEELEAAADEIARLEAALAATDNATDSTSADDTLPLREQLATVTEERDTARKLSGLMYSRLTDYAKRLTVMRGWIEVLAQGYLTPEGITRGARKAGETLTDIIRDITGNPKG